MRKNNNKEKMEEIKDKLIKGTQAIYDSGLWKDYLTTMSKFTDYSLNNCILIVSQCPQASLVCGFKKWKNDFNRNVIKGEKGIMIFAPHTKKIEVKKTDKDGKEETSEEKYTYFRPCYVFDVSQTEGDPLPSIVTKLDNKVDNYKELKGNIISTSPVPVLFDDIQGEANGFYSPAKQKIVIQKGMSELQTIKTLLHEIAHATLKHGSKEDKWTRQDQEVQAESIAFWVASLLNLDTSDYSFGYIASWSKSKEIEMLKENLDIIKNTANELFKKLEKNQK